MLHIIDGWLQIGITVCGTNRTGKEITVSGKTRNLGMFVRVTSSNSSQCIPAENLPASARSFADST